MVQLKRSTNSVHHQYDYINDIPSKYSYDTTAICRVYDCLYESRTNIHYRHKLELVNVNQTEPLRFFVPYKHPTRVMVCLLKIIILDTNNVLPVNIGYNLNGNSVACLRCSSCYVCIYNLYIYIYLSDHFDQFVPVSVFCVNLSSFPSLRFSSSLSTVSAPVWETYQMQVKGIFLWILFYC